MFIGNDKTEILKLILTLLRYPGSGNFAREKSKERLYGNNTLFFAAVPHYLFLNFQNRLPGIRKQPSGEIRNYRLLVFIVVEAWREYSFIILLVLLILWFYRRYEIKRIRRINVVNKQNYESRVSLEDDDSNSFLPLDNKQATDHCLTGKCDKRFCFFNTDGNLIHVENSGSEPASVEMLLKKINANKFCQQVCWEKEDYRFPASRFITREINSSKNNFSEYQYPVVPIKPYNTLNEFNQAVDLSSFFTTSSIVHLRDVAISPIDKEFISKAVKIIEANYSNYHFSAEQLARESNMSVSQVNRKLNSLIGLPAGRLISKFRLQHAAEFLVKSTDTISDVCFSAGYNGLAYFSRAFKKEYGCTPSVYRQLMTKKSISVRK